MFYNKLNQFKEKVLLKITSIPELIEKYKHILPEEKYQQFKEKYNIKNNFSNKDVNILNEHFAKHYQKVKVLNFRNGEYHIVTYTPCHSDNYIVKIEDEKVIFLKRSGGFSSDGDCEHEWDDWVKQFK